VPVYGFGTGDFPAFYLRESGLRADQRFDSVEELANAVRNHFELGLGTGVVVGNPIAAEHELPRGEFEGALTRALAEADEQNVRGRHVTPFLLERLAVDAPHQTRPGASRGNAPRRRAGAGAPEGWRAARAWNGARRVDRARAVAVQA
jgi:pseudouridine-5'-phosphate glycosidase